MCRMLAPQRAPDSNSSIASPSHPTQIEDAHSFYEFSFQILLCMSNLFIFELKIEVFDKAHDYLHHNELNP